MEDVSIASMIKILSETIGRRAKKDFREFNLTLQQMKILWFLKSREGELETSQKDIQKHLRVAHPTIVSILKGMETKGFITAFPSEKDRRMKIVQLTGKEECIFRELEKGREKMEAQLPKGFSSEDQERLLCYLKLLYENIREE